MILESLICYHCKTYIIKLIYVLLLVNLEIAGTRQIGIFRDQYERKDYFFRWIFEVSKDPSCDQLLNLISLIVV